MKKSAGIFLYNTITKKFLILHPSGETNVNAKWGIPKGEIDNPDTEEVAYFLEALRELKEETGIVLNDEELSTSGGLGSVVYLSKLKKLFAFLVCTTRDFNIVLDWENDKYMWIDYPTMIEMCHESHARFKVMEPIKLYTKKGFNLL